MANIHQRKLTLVCHQEDDEAHNPLAADVFSITAKEP